MLMIFGMSYTSVIPYLQNKPLAKYESHLNSLQTLFITHL